MVELYIHRNSIVHAMPFYLKCFIVSLIIFCVYFFDNIYILSAALIFSFVVYFVAHLPLLYWWKSVRLVLPFLCIAIVYHIFTKNYNLAFVVSARIIIAISIANIISLSTSFRTILQESKKIFFVLSWFKISPALPGLVINIVIRSIPLLYLEKQEIEYALALRGVKKRIKGKHKRFKLSYFIFILLLRTIRQTEDLSYSIYLRGGIQ